MFANSLTQAAAQKKNSNAAAAAAAASAEAAAAQDAEPPTPATPMTPGNAAGFKPGQAGGVVAGAAASAPAGPQPTPAPAAAPAPPPAQQSHPDQNSFMDNSNGMVSVIVISHGNPGATEEEDTNSLQVDFPNMDFANPLTTGDVLTDFDFDAFLHDGEGDNGTFDFNTGYAGMEGTGEIGAE
jgi:hypothetical protein